MVSFFVERQPPELCIIVNVCDSERLEWLNGLILAR